MHGLNACHEARHEGLPPEIDLGGNSPRLTVYGAEVRRRYSCGVGFAAVATPACIEAVYPFGFRVKIDQLQDACV